MEPTVAPHALQVAIDHLRALPFVEDIEIRQADAAEAIPAIGRHEATMRVDVVQVPAAVLAIRAGERWHDYRLRAVDRPVDAQAVNFLRAKAEQQPNPPTLVLARRVPTDRGAELREAGICYVDVAGNCFLQIGREHVAWIGGRRHQGEQGPGPGKRGLGVPGCQVELALLVDPDLVNRPVREIGNAAGVGKTAAADLLDRLRAQGIVVQEGNRRRLVDRQRLVEDWLAGYDRLLRPRLLVGEFEAPDAGEPERLQARLRAELAHDDAWGFGGGIAAQRWTGHWRGDLTVLHHLDPADLARRLKLLRARRGRIQILRAPFRATLDVEQHLAHPLLVYADLIGEGHERAREAATEVRRHFPAVFA